MTSPNIYQQAVREMYEAIADVDTVKTCKAQYNAMIEGKTSTHEVEAYWEFTDGDITYKVVIQAKEQASLAELFIFLRMLRDIPGQVIGVVVTQPVYQKDIKDMAANAGILLCELTQPITTEVWEPVVSNVQVNVDRPWVKQAKEQAGLGDEPVQVSADPKYSFIYDEAGNCIDTVQGIFDQYGKQHKVGSGEPQTIVHTFSVPTFLQTNHVLVPFIKLDNIMFDVELANVNHRAAEDMLANIVDIILKYFGK